MIHLLEWKPFEKQQHFLKVPNQIFEALYGGAAGGGKTELILNIPIVKQYYKNPKFQGIIFRRKFPEIEASLEPRANIWYKAVGGEYNQQRHTWKFPSGASIKFGHMEEDKDARSHDTNEYQYIGFDELTAFTEFQYRYLTSRCRSSDPSLDPIIRGATNPGNIGNTWVRSRFVEPCREGGKIIRDPQSGNMRIYIHADLSDNPHIDKEYRNRLELLPEAEKRAKLYGDWWVFSGAVFTEFRAQHFPDEPDNARHVIESFDIPAWWPKILSIDWGFAAKTFAIWSAISPDGRIFVYREYQIRRAPIKVWAADIARLSQWDENLQTVCLDPSAWQNRGEQTIADQFINATGFTEVEKADNDRLGGKMLMHDLLRWKPRPAKYVPKEGYNKDVADRILRMGGLDALHSYEASFIAEPEEKNIPRFQIFETCPETIKAIQLCVYDEHRTEDVAEWDGDDPWDCLRYNIKACDRYENQSFAEHKKRQRIEKVIEELQRTGNQTSFYRQMEAVERANGAKIPFGRHRSGRAYR
jgi:hypothetical protein